jgi:DNA-directed RNA polymerase subunit RPC12/RpoP
MSPRDILFECPACRKSLVVDEAAEGLIVDCPQCHINVIVPPKPAPPKPAPAKPVVAQPPVAATESDDLRSRLVTITSKLKELQTQRTEINNRLASRLNDINRDLVMQARLETAQQQVIAELTQLVGQIGTSAGTSAAGRTRVNLRS